MLRPQLAEVPLLLHSQSQFEAFSCRMTSMKIASCCWMAPYLFFGNKAVVDVNFSLYNIDG